MRTSMVLGLGIAATAAVFHFYPKRVDTGDRPKGVADRSATRERAVALAEAAPGPTAPLHGPGSESAAAAGVSPTARPAPSSPATTAPPDEGAVEAPATGDDSPAAALLREGIEALMSGDEPRGALALFRAARSREKTRDRSAVLDAERRLLSLASSAEARAAKAREAGALAEERAALSAAYLATLDASKRAPLKARLDELVQALIFSPRPSDCAVVHTVARGESLVKIAAKYDFPADGIALVNRLRTDRLRTGERLKVPKGPVELLVHKAEFRLVVLFAGLYARQYSVGTGHDDCTPETSFVVETKIKEPTWHSKDGVFPFGDPRNILGTRWMGFKDHDDLRGFGIHGTSFPETIGSQASSGCIRMRNSDVEELFGLCPKGATVIITR